MAGAAHIDDMDCDASLKVVAETVMRVRLSELLERRGLISGPEDVTELHDLRIAAKRVRYCLEVFRICFPHDRAAALEDQMKGFQEVLGRIHDLDVLHGLLTGRLLQMDEEAVSSLENLPEAGEGEDRDQRIRELVLSEENNLGRFGLLKVIAGKLDERRRRYVEFEDAWHTWVESGELGETASYFHLDARTAAPTMPE